MTDALMYAKYNMECDATVYDILSRMSNAQREEARGSFYGSLSGLLRHVLGGTYFFLTLIKPALEGNAAALKTISSMPEIPGDGELDGEGWRKLGETMKAVDAAYVDMAQALGAADMGLPVKLDWYGGNPDSVPLSFMLSQLLVHNTHHRGQISQILDGMKIENDFSGIGILP